MTTNNKFDIAELISVIVPIYNAEKYIERCVESIVNQTYSNVEILLINDGSSDNSLLICQSLAEKDSRIVVLTKPNTGVSDTRNLGIEKANGELLFFVDADDYISEETLHILHQNMKDANADISCCSYYSKSDEQITNDVTYIMNDESFIRDLNCYVVWGKLYKKSLIKNIHFDTNISSGEDTLFIIKAYLKSQCVVATENQLYYYFQNDESITHSEFSTRRYSVVNAYEECIEILAKQRGEKSCIYKDICGTLAIHAYILSFLLWRVDNYNVNYPGIDLELKRILKKYGRYVWGLNRPFNVKLKLYLLMRFRTIYHFLWKSMKR